MIGLAALLQLVDWFRRVDEGISKEDYHASIWNSRCPPPRPTRLISPIDPSQFWLALLAGQRERILHALSRVVVQQLTKPPMVREVTHEQS